MESTENTRVWHEGPPPHVGWWNASTTKDHAAWRWWDGKQWSRATYPHQPAEYAAKEAACAADVQDVEWADYWPRGARVPRIDPRAPKVEDNTVKELAEQIAILRATNTNLAGSNNHLREQLAVAEHKLTCAKERIETLNKAIDAKPTAELEERFVGLLVDMVQDPKLAAQVKCTRWFNDALVYATRHFGNITRLCAAIDKARADRGLDTPAPVADWKDSIDTKPMLYANMRAQACEDAMGLCFLEQLP